MPAENELKTELLQKLESMSKEDLEIILRSWVATKEMQKRPGYENCFVILR